MQITNKDFSSTRKATATRRSPTCWSSGIYLTALVCLSMVACPVEATGSSHQVNPVRRVISMLQMMQRKTEQEGDNAQAIFDKYMCYCQANLRKLGADIDMGKSAVPQLESRIEEEVAEMGALKNDITDAKADSAEAQKTLDEASSLRTKENKDFKAEDGGLQVNIEGLTRAIKSMDRLSDGGFLQMDVVSTIRHLATTSVDLTTSDRDIITNFLSERDSQQESGSDGFTETNPNEITGILKQMAETMTKDKAQGVVDEKAAVTQFDSLKSAKESQLIALRKDINSKTERLGSLGLELVQDKMKLTEAQRTLESNEKLEASLSKECDARHNEFNVAVQDRAEELTAIQETIQLLNDDASSKLFKKTFPSAAAASLLQMQVSPKQLRGQALKTLQSALPKGKRDPRMDFVALALRSKKTSFTKVLGMIDDMVILLNKEQKDDEAKKKYCESEIAMTKDEQAEIEQGISDLNKAIDDANQKAKTLTADIKGKEDGIKTLDAQVADATKLRKEEHQDYMANLQANNAAKEILGVAKVRLGRFFNKDKALVQTQAKKQVVGKALKIKSLEKHKNSGVAVGHSLSARSKASLSALFSFVQVDAETQAHRRKEQNAVITLIASLIADIDKDVKAMTHDEKEAQFEYEYATKESAEKRAADAKTLSELVGFKAEAEAQLHTMASQVKAKKKESAGKGTYLADLHKSCDWLQKNFQTRRDARSSEIDALQKAKDVLSGEDAGFLQVNMRTWRGLRRAKRRT